MLNLFQKTLRAENNGRPPVWFMRQAGRYHRHYQELKLKHSFIELCKIPKLACEATMGPIRDFDFDAAILFSDLLFPLECMGMGLDYTPGPKLDFLLRAPSDLKRLRGGGQLVSGLGFQAEALHLIRKELSPEKGLIGFVGGPLTLYSYAVLGSHKEQFQSAFSGLRDGRWEGFLERLFDLLLENMVLQAQTGLDALAILDTCAGSFSLEDYREFGVTSLKKLVDAFSKRCPDTALIYYSKGTNAAYWSSLKDCQFRVLGIDWLNPLPEVLKSCGLLRGIQGNIDPSWLFFEPSLLEEKLRAVFLKVRELPIEYRRAWVCGLGHGVLPKTPEANVRLFLKVQKEIFADEGGGP